MEIQILFVSLDRDNKTGKLNGVRDLPRNMSTEIIMDLNVAQIFKSNNEKYLDMRLGSVRSII